MKIHQAFKLTYPAADRTSERIVIAESEEWAKTILRHALGRPNLEIHCIGPVEVLEES